MNFLLDTHILLWWALGDSRLPGDYSSVLKKVDELKASVSLSIISFWEVAQLHDRGRLQLQTSLEQWFHKVESHPCIKVVPLNSRIIIESMRLGASFHKDPADRMIVATARSIGAHLMTVDQKIINSRVVGIV